MISQDGEHGEQIAHLIIDEELELWIYGAYTFDGMLYTCIDNKQRCHLKRVPELVALAAISHLLNAKHLSPPIFETQALSEPHVLLHWLLIGITWHFVYFDAESRLPSRPFGLMCLDGQQEEQKALSFDDLLRHIEQSMSNPPIQPMPGLHPIRPSHAAATA